MPGADDRADAEARQLDRTEHAAQPILALHFLEQLLERLRREQLAHHLETSSLALTSIELGLAWPARLYSAL